MPTPAATTFDPETKYRLLLRVHSAEDLPHKSSQGAYCKLYVGDTAMLDGLQKKLTKSDSTGGDDNNNVIGDDEDAHRVFRTQTKAAVVSPTTQKSETTWDEIFEVSVRDPNTEVLSLRVKSQHRFYCPVIGTFAVYLHHLRVGHQADQWFPLRRGKKEAGKIRLHLLLTPEHVAPGGAGGRGKKKRNGSDMAPDIKVALAANFEADLAIQRLVAKQLKDEEDRKARRLRGEKSDDEDNEHENNNNQRFQGSVRGANDAVTKQMDVLSIAKMKEPTQAALGSGRGDVRFPVLLPPSPSAQNNRGNAPVVSASSDNNARRSENFARLNQLETVAVVVKEGRHQGDAMGSGRSSSSARYAVPGLIAVSTNSRTSRSSPTSPAGSGAQQRSGLFGVDMPASLSAAAATTSGGERLSEADRNHRRKEKFAHLKELDADPVPHLGSGRGGGSSRSSLPNTPSSSNHRQSLNSPVGSANGSARQHHPGLYSIPSFGPADFNQRSKRHSGSSTDSDSLASAAEYERRIDRKLRKVRKQTEKLKKIKAQLRKYIPDLTDSDSDDAASSGSSGSLGSSGGEKHKSAQRQQQSRSSTSTSSGRDSAQRHYF